MVINDAIIKELAQEHFNGTIPDELCAYLFDRYDHDPEEGMLTEQFFFPFVEADIKRYIAGELDTTVRTPLQKMQDRYNDLQDITGRYYHECAEYSDELEYLHDFISWMHLDGLYAEFREKARKVQQDDLPFQRYEM